MSPTGDAVPLAPGATVGILGGGQLGRMLALAAAPLGLRVHVFCPDPLSPAFEVSANRTIAGYDDEAALGRFADAVDVVTYEFENVPGATAAFLAARRPVRPGPKALEIAQDRLTEKSFLEANGINVAPFRRVDSRDGLAVAFSELGGPAILKTRRLGYDGKGQYVLREEADIDAGWRAVGGVPSILEKFIAFEREISVIAARDIAGRCEAYDIPENRHSQQILRSSTVPASIDSTTRDQAIEYAERLLGALDYVGVLAIEMFVASVDGREHLIANEIAPRVHNSGHWTQDACQVGQFAQHIRAVAGWPLGPAGRHSDAVMSNLIGDEVAAWPALLADPAASLHLYGKTETRAGRKMGHVTRLRPKTSS